VHDPTQFQPLTQPAQDALGDARANQHRAGQGSDHQMAGRRWPVACVSLEVTQRCNLDCTLCYLSESSEAVRDFPLDEIYRRIDSIVAHYGAGTDVQVSGGEPTLRRRDELVAIVRRLASKAMPARDAGAGAVGLHHRGTAARRAGGQRRRGDASLGDGAGPLRR